MLSCFKNSMMCLMCTVVVTESCYLSSDKNEWNTACHVCDCGVAAASASAGALKCFIKIPSIDTDLPHP